MNRTDLRKLSNARIREAMILLIAEERSGAYYLAGYSVECAFKACIAKSVQRHNFPDKDRVNKSFSHSLIDLAKLADVFDALKAEMQTGARLLANWKAMGNWSEHSRYSSATKDGAKELIDAILSRKGGVLPWIKRRW